MNGMVRNLERLAFETCFLNNLGFLMDIESCEREFHGLMTLVCQWSECVTELGRR